MGLGPLFSGWHGSGQSDHRGPGKRGEVQGAYGQSQRGVFPRGAVLHGTSGVCMAGPIFTRYEGVSLDTLRGEEVRRNANDCPPEPLPTVPGAKKLGNVAAGQPYIT